MFFDGSEAPVSVTDVEVMASVKYFQLPKILLGITGAPPCCQSLVLRLTSLVMSVTNSAGNSGLPEPSEDPGAPAGALVP